MKKPIAITMTVSLLVACGSAGDPVGDDRDASIRLDGGEVIDPDAGDEEEAWIPEPLAANRFAVFYQIGADVLEIYADPELGVPQSPEHAYVFAHSHASAPADRALGDLIHSMRPDFKYAPCFDLNDHDGWATASDDELAAMAHEFRDKALRAHADLFCLNEAYSNTPTSETHRVHLAKLIRYINDPDPDGARLRGVFFLTEAAATPSNWDTPASLFWQAVNEVSDAVVAEHYHGMGYVCDNSIDFLRDHFFALRRWLVDSGEPAKLEIASEKFVVLHSSRYGPGQNGWQGANSDTTSLAAFQRNLSRVTQVTRSTEGGVNRISFGPTATVYTDIGVHPRIRALLRWHYAGEAPGEGEVGCIGGADVNCQCQ